MSRANSTDRPTLRPSDQATDQFSQTFKEALVYPLQWLATLAGAMHLFARDQATRVMMSLILLSYLAAYSWIVQGDPDPAFIDIVFNYVLPILGDLFFGLIIHSILASPFKWPIIGLFPIMMMATNPHHYHLREGIMSILKTTRYSAFNYFVQLVRSKVMLPRDAVGATQANHDHESRDRPT
ncbi:uncharacterized protein LOC116206140 [Punica granatum]|uniref:Uncharacterized protein n=2 Tax=Punica granatum TaxID=22663 RepID=A0A218VYK4_PUNGR|nr:uncharacterized protein LOC116206140 [Punica granatum]OWM64962.1 hypothetical protein CDL15_Pgr028680 [Punica granatum]PKI67085.1 hypothetical protein CRG98_012506 [Punica granatum]